MAKAKQVEPLRARLNSLESRLRAAPDEKAKAPIEADIKRTNTAIENTLNEDLLAIPEFDLRKPTPSSVGKPWAQFGISESSSPGEHEKEIAHVTWTCIGHPRKHDGTRWLAAVPKVEIAVVIHQLPKGHEVKHEHRCYEVLKIKTIVDNREKKPMLEVKEIDANELWGDILAMKERQLMPKPKPIPMKKPNGKDSG